MVRDDASVTATVYLEINSLLQELLSGARALLGPRFIGMYLDGSLAIDDFDPVSSDVDFVVVTDGELPPQMFEALETMH
jgi:predicted nucleotidyltransferase